MAPHFAFEVCLPVLTSILVICDGVSETLLTPCARNWRVSPVTDSIVPTCLSPPKAGDDIRALEPGIGGQIAPAAVCAKPVTVVPTRPAKIKARNFISVPRGGVARSREQLRYSMMSCSRRLCATLRHAPGARVLTHSTKWQNDITT